MKSPNMGIIVIAGTWPHHIHVPACCSQSYVNFARILPVCSPPLRPVNLEALLLPKDSDRNQKLALAQALLQVRGVGEAG